MLLAIDIGNTDIIIGIYDNDTLVYNWEVSTNIHETVDEYGLLFRQLCDNVGIKKEDINAIILSSVVPVITDIVPNTFRKYFCINPIIVKPGIKTGIDILYSDPKEVGADRIVNSVAAYEKYGGPIIILDMGTALSVDIVNDKGQYLGGMIAPSTNVSADALFKKTSKLPRIEMEKPESVIGKSTISGIKSGLFYGLVGMVDKLIEEVLKKLKLSSEEITIISTGGLSEEILSESQFNIHRDELLTLAGLKIIYDKNI